MNCSLFLQLALALTLALPSPADKFPSPFGEGLGVRPLSEEKPSPKIIKGKASWYNAHGKFTANGERFHRDSLTCAHKTFPFGTRLKVRNITNGREVIVRVTDRGPFGGKYCIDLSIAAARILGIIRMGFAEVEITEYEETIVPLKAGPIKIPDLEFGSVNLENDYTPEWKIYPLPPIK